ncbi:MAG: conjugal transfer protein TraR [Ignavibacteriales bacterium]|nr:conjugal transfer protein TraR [Ignavibacteriales bacterium]
MAKKVVKKTVTKKSAAKPKVAKKAASKTKKAVKPAAKPKLVKEKKAVKKETAQKKSAAPSTSQSKKAKHVEVISPTKKVKKILGYSKKDLEEFKKVILEKRNEIIEQLQALKDQMMDPSTGQYVNENSPYSLHMAEQGTDAMEREKLYLWAQRENKFLGYLDDALQRIENGTYGICIECIDEPQHLCPTCPLIPKERLLAVPHTQHCLQVKQKMKKY